MALGLANTYSVKCEYEALIGTLLLGDFKTRNVVNWHSVIVYCLEENICNRDKRYSD